MAGTKMASPIFLYRIFIASPGDLTDERRTLIRAIDEYNKHEAVRRGIMFEAVIWEDSPPGRGRPQSHLNRRLRDCDFFFLMLGERWGSTPANTDSLYSSGTEEEYYEARNCCDNAEFPMRDIAVVFKEIGPEARRDPGPQLKSVLDFKERLNETKDLYYTTFDSQQKLEDTLRRCLAKWAADIESDKHALWQDPEKSEIQYTGDRLSFNFQDIEVRAVVQLIADFTGLNIVCSDTVRGALTMRLKNVPWDQALDVILKTKGLDMRQNGNVILIAPTVEFAAQDKLELESAIQKAELKELLNRLKRMLGE